VRQPTVGCRACPRTSARHRKTAGLRVEIAQLMLIAIFLPSAWSIPASITFADGIAGVASDTQGQRAQIG